MILTEPKRLIIRSWTIEDTQNYFHIVSDPEVMKFIGNGETLTLEEAKSYIIKCMKSFPKKDWSRFAVIDRESKDLIGFCGYAEYNDELDFGWRYAKRFWGKDTQRRLQWPYLNWV